ncbi:MAG: hypothetical protein JWN01_977 [Patescibacteria group bacterium]|nr:hypothetical protein [Patescibacteria group bacterium]
MLYAHRLSQRNDSELANPFVLGKPLLVALGQKFVLLLQCPLRFVRTHVKHIVQVLLLRLNIRRLYFAYSRSPHGSTLIKIVDTV